MGYFANPGEGAMPVGHAREKELPRPRPFLSAAGSRSRLGRVYFHNWHGGR